jgi:Hermes transposase DNA-binding domain
VSCIRCKKLLTYDKVKGGTSHLRRHGDSCNAKGLTSSSTPSIDNYFKSSCVPLAAKTVCNREMCRVCGGIRPFETIAGDGFRALAQAFIGIGVKYGQVSASNVIPNPTTVSRKISDTATKLKLSPSCTPL